MCAEFLDRIFAARFSGLPSEWSERHIHFNEPEIKGRFSFSGREYLRDIVDDITADATDFVYVMGTGTGKTISLMAQRVFEIINSPFRALWVFPGSDGPGGAGSFVKTRFMPCLKATPVTLEKYPAGADRFDAKADSIRMAGSVMDFVGSNSPAQVAANRCGRVICDEVDKFFKGNEDEPSAAYNADRRTDGVEGAKRFKASSPTREGGLIWSEFLKSDQQRRFLPCPHCAKEVVLAWASWEKEKKIWLPFTCFRLQGYEAFIRWDVAALKNGEWDYDEAARSAHYECPHCHGRITDAHKFDMDRAGVWRATAKGFPKYTGRHLPSMYASSSECRAGALVLEFLKSPLTESGVKGFINSRLAEVDEKQQRSDAAIEVGKIPISQPDWVTLLTGDFQKNWPHLWFTARKWCAFKLLPPPEMVDGKPDWAQYLELPGNEEAKNRCEKLAGGLPQAWPVLAELNRFDSRSGNSPAVDFLIAQNIKGENLVKFFHEQGNGKAMEFRAAIYREMGLVAARGGDSELVSAGHLALSGDYIWEELADIIKEFKVGEGMPIPNRCVAIDCGYAERFNREILRKCYESASEFKYYDPTSRNRPALFYNNPINPYCQTAPADGWLALKGYPMNQRWNHGGVKNELNINIEDPFFGTADAGRSVCEVLEIPSGYFWLRKEDFRQKRVKQAYFVSPEVSWFPKIKSRDGQILGGSNFRQSDYEKHLNEQIYNEAKGIVEPRHGRGGAQGRRYPFHLDDCETYQIALASYHEFFDSETKK